MLIGRMQTLKSFNIFLRIFVIELISHFSSGVRVWSHRNQRVLLR